MTRKKRGKCCKFLPCCSDAESEAIEDFANFEDTTLARGRVLLKRYEESHPPRCSSVKDTETEIEEINITQRSPPNAPADGILDITPELDSSSSVRDQSDDATDDTRGKDSKARKHHSVPAEIDIVARHVKSPHSTQPLQVDSGRVDVDVKIKKRHSVPEDKAQRASREAIRTPHGIQPLQIKKRYDESDAKLKDSQSVSADEVEKTIRDVIKRPHSAQKKNASYGHDISATEDDLKATRNIKTPLSSEQEDVSGKCDADAEVRRSPSIQDVSAKQTSKDSSKTSLCSQESDKVLKRHRISEGKNIQDVDRNLQSQHVTESAEFSSGSDDNNVQIKKVTRDDADAKIKNRRSKPEDKAKATPDAIKQPHEFKESKVNLRIDCADAKTRKQPNINEDKIKTVSRYDITASDDFQRVQVHSESVDRKVKKYSGPTINGDSTSPPLPASEDVQKVKHDTHPPGKPEILAVEDKNDILDIDAKMEKHKCVATEDRAQVATSGAQTSHHISQHFETVTGKLTMKAEDNAVHQVDSTEAQATAAIADLHRPSSLPVVLVRDMQAAEHDHFVVKAAGGSPKVKKDKLRFVKSVHSENVCVSDTLRLMSREEEVHFLTLDTEDELEAQECKAQKRKSKIPVRVKVQEKSDSASDHSSGSTTKLPAHQNRSSTRLPVPQTKSTTKLPAPPSTATAKSSSSNTKQPSPPSKSTTKHSACQGKSTTKQPSPPNRSATKDSAPQSKSKSSMSTTKQSSPPNTSTAKQPSPPNTSTTKQPCPPNTSTTKQPSPPNTSTTKQPSPPNTSTTKQPSPPNTSTTKQPSPPNTSTTKQPSPPNTSTTKQPSPPNTSTTKQPSPTNTSTTKQPAPPPVPPSGPIRKPRVSRASKAKLPDDKFKFMKKDDELPSPPDSDESISLKPANTKMKIPELFLDENAAAQKQESSGSDTDPDFYKLIGFDLDKARALKHAVTKNYFDELEKLVYSLGLDDKPHVIWNIDETSVPLPHKPTKVMADLTSAWIHQEKGELLMFLLLLKQTIRRLLILLHLMPECLLH
ncbi:serine/arginine repetitive matrix protein 1-like [Haliotis rubra]|uniref:serine/arginine repetitive matrix protein 1-like n=1 Tax=Haliotis rubra TaxID=36100 RepID=UPI001EE5DCC4|nr:serine/arginine repetitive matrix protein 1-like [Haliotis rubra]